MAEQLKFYQCSFCHFLQLNDKVCVRCGGDNWRMRFYRMSKIDAHLANKAGEDEAERKIKNRPEKVVRLNLKDG